MITRCFYRTRNARGLSSPMINSFLFFFCIYIYIYTYPPIPIATLSFVRYLFLFFFPVFVFFLLPKPFHYNSSRRLSFDGEYHPYISTERGSGEGYWTPSLKNVFNFFHQIFARARVTGNNFYSAANPCFPLCPLRWPPYTHTHTHTHLGKRIDSLCYGYVCVFL